MGPCRAAPGGRQGGCCGCRVRPYVCPQAERRDSMADIFISYKRQDRRRIEAMSQALVDLGLSVWFDYSIDVGEDWSKRITSELEAARAVIVCWSPEACLSSWVLRE